MTSEPEWTLDDFDTWLARWRVSEKPDPDLGLTVTAWVLSRTVTPFEGAEPVSDQPGMWFAWIPNSGDGCGNMVCCSYWVDHATHTATCHIINSLSYP